LHRSQNVVRKDRTSNELVIVVAVVLVVEVVVTATTTAVLVVNMIPVVVRLAAGVVVLGACIYCARIYM
jgi:hypothetical protein